MMLVLFWSNFSIFVSQMCFCFFFTCGSVSPALASGYCTIFWSAFTVPRFPIMVVGGALLQDLIFSRGPFSGPHLGKPFPRAILLKPLGEKGHHSAAAGRCRLLLPLSSFFGHLVPLFRHRLPSAVAAGPMPSFWLWLGFGPEVGILIHLAGPSCFSMAILGTALVNLFGSRILPKCFLQNYWWAKMP